MKKLVTIVAMVLMAVSAYAQGEEDVSLGYYDGGNIVELIPIDPSAYRFVMALDEESRKAIDDLLAGKMMTEDQSIVKILDHSGKNEWYVKNGYPLPEGNYYESAVYKCEFFKTKNDNWYIILPTITISTKGDAQIDGLLEYLGSKVKSKRSEDSSGRVIYKLTCQMKTSEEVLQTIWLIYSFGIDGIWRIMPGMYTLTPSSDSYFIKMLTGNTQPFVPKHAGEKLIYEMDWAGVEYSIIWEFEIPEESYEGTPEGLAITNPRKKESPWYLTTQVSDSRGIFLERNHDYIVRLTIKIPSDGELGVYLMGGGWSKAFANLLSVTASDDFQEIDVMFTDFGGNDEDVFISDYLYGGLVSISSGDLVGATVVQKVQVIEVDQSAKVPEPLETDDLKLIAEKDWTKEADYSSWEMFDNTDWEHRPKLVEEGLALTNPEVQAQIWIAQAMVLDNFSLEQNHDYLVRLFLKVPSDGTYQVNMGSWSVNVNTQVSVTGSDDFQMIDAEFPQFAGDAENVEGLETCHVMLQCGWVVGTTILKKVQVYEKINGGTTAIKAVKATNAESTIYNLAGQKVDTSYKGIVIQNGKKRLAR